MSNPNFIHFSNNQPSGGIYRYAVYPTGVIKKIREGRICWYLVYSIGVIKNIANNKDK